MLTLKVSLGLRIGLPVASVTEITGWLNSAAPLPDDDEGVVVKVKLVGVPAPSVRFIVVVKVTDPDPVGVKENVTT